MTEYHVDKLKFEVEVPNAGLPNMVYNTDGALGAWNWETPFPSTYLAGSTSGTQRLLLNQAFGGTTVRAQTEALPIAAAQYVGGRFDALATSTASTYYRYSWAFYTSAGVFISQSTLSAYTLATTAQTIYVPATVAPATTAYVRLILDYYGNNVGGNPTSASHLDFTNVMVTKAASAAAIGENRTNLITNPSFETNTTGWSGTSGSVSLSQSAVQAWTGTKSMLVTMPYYGGAQATFTMSASTTYIASGYFYSAGAGQVDIRFKWTTPSGDVYTGGTLNALGTGSWQRFSFVDTAPSNATAGAVIFDTNGSNFYLDGVVVEQGTTLNAYYAGSITNATYPFQSANGWQDVIGPVYEFSIEHEPLDVGTLSASILSSNLDPSISTVLRPGKGVRLMANNSGVWTPVYTGRISAAKVTYQKAKGGALTDRGAVRISLEAIDNAAVLAQKPEPRGVEFINELNELIEGKGVPWNINNSRNQTSYAAGVPPVIAYNESAKVLDQIAITRDTQRGYAWVDRYGVINVFDRGTIPSTSLVTFSDLAAVPVSYTDIDVSWNSEEIINSVTIKWLRYNSGSSTTEEIDYPIGGGAYVNQASIDTYGTFSKEFTIQGGTETEALIKAYAQNILDANSTPVVKTNSLTLQVTNATEMLWATSLDLYGLVTVRYADRVNGDLRITGIKHDITPNEWNVTYTFGANGGAAATINTPGPGETNDSLGWTNLTLGTNITNTGSGWYNVQGLRVGNTIRLRGLGSCAGIGAGAVIATIPTTIFSGTIGGISSMPADVLGAGGIPVAGYRFDVNANRTITSLSAIGAGAYISFDNVTIDVA